MKRSRPQCFLACVLLLLPLSPGALADGIYIGETAYKVPPSIPSQLAILAYRDGTETLIIESALEAEGTQFGWIIPVPAQPTRFEKTSPGVLKTLSLAIGPKVIHETRGLRFFAFTMLFVVALWSIIIILWKPENPDRLFIRILLYTLFVLLFFSMFMFHLGVDIGMDYAVAVKDIQQVGSYEIAVLDANSPEGLNRWLQSNGFVTLNEDESSVVTDYISEGWYFIAAKLQRQGGGYSEPHPVAITFPFEKPVYPMRLTAFATDELYLEIAVISDQTVSTPLLTLECSDTYCLKPDAARAFGYGTPLKALVGQKYEQMVGHPDASSVLWEGCVISKLAGVLGPKQMAKDLEFEMGPATHKQKRYFSYTAALWTAVSMGIVLWSLAMLVTTSHFYQRIKNQNGIVFYMRKVLLPVTLISAVLALAIYAALDKTRVQTLSGSHPALRRDIEMGWLDYPMKEATENHEELAHVGADELREFVAQHYADSDIRNRYTGERIIEEDSPGNYTIFEDERGVVWRSYTSEGFAVDFVLAEEFK
jgi:hypothetical protein